MSVYRGRFAPSPTGPLHFGSLFAAVISFLDAQHNNGEWLVRIEDIDPLREQANASKKIIETLECHALVPDNEIIYQSSRNKLYEKTLALLEDKALAYKCPCSRNYLKQHNGLHQADCQKQSFQTSNYAVKFKVAQTSFEQYPLIWDDQFQGVQTRLLSEDFVLKRKEGFFAYQLAVVCDDIEQGITNVVRGFDLLESTPMQLAIYQALGYPSPRFAHFPVITFKNGQKLSKQNKAKAINNTHALANLLQVFSYIGLNLKHQPDNCKNALNEALECWDVKFLLEKSELKQVSQY